MLSHCHTVNRNIYRLVGGERQMWNNTRCKQNDYETHCSLEFASVPFESGRKLFKKKQKNRKSHTKVIIPVQSINVKECDNRN